MRAASRLWMIQVVTGVVLMLLLGLHLVANHTGPEGILTHREVVRRLQDPAIATVEVAFLVVVVLHAVLGMRSVLQDYVPARRMPAVRTALNLLGILAVLYGVGLTVAVQRFGP